MMYFLSSYFLLFLLYSIMGYIVEVIFVSIKSKKIIFNRGFLIGPYLPIYGFGSLIMVLFLKQYEDDLFVLFITGAFLCAALEYFTSLIMEKLFNFRWWDYSDRKFNLNGRVCLDNACLFGLSGIFVVKIIHPFFVDIIYFLPSNVCVGLGIFFFILFFIDVIESCYITVRLKINLNNFIHRDATREIKKEVMKAVGKHVTLTSRLLRAFPNVTYEANKKFVDFMKLIYNTKRDLKIQKLKKKIKKVENR